MRIPNRLMSFSLGILVLLMSPTTSAGIERDVKQLDLSEAQQRLNRFDLEPKMFFFDGGNSQFGFGVRATGYGTERLHFPVTLYSTELPGGEDMFYLTLGIGYDYPLSDKVELQLNAGAGFAAFEDDNAAFALEPIAGIAFKPGRWVRLGLNAGYLAVWEGRPAAWTAAASIQFKTFSLTWPD